MVRELGTKTALWGDESTDSYRIFGAGGGIRADSAELFERFMATDDELWYYEGPDISLAEYFRKYVTDTEAGIFKQREISDTMAADAEKISVHGLDVEEMSLLSSTNNNFFIVDTEVTTFLCLMIFFCLVSHRV
jgi:hypothetical protein